VLSYLEQFAEQIHDVGVQAFSRLYPWPSLIALGMAGDLDRSSTSGTTIIRINDSVLERGRIAGRVFALTKSSYSPKGPITIGRTAENDVVIPEYSVSRKHCFIAMVNGGYRITDWGSANGTLVNEKEIGKMTPFPLQGREILTLGRLMVLFLLPQQFVEHVRGVAPPAGFENG
jgi:hypothetical protein